MEIVTKRIYQPAVDGDGFRVLVDRLWPRGVSKERARLDLWDKEAAPSTQLRQWWGHDLNSFDEFERRYRAELDASGAAAQLLVQLQGQDRVTLLYAANTADNNASVLVDYLGQLQGRSEP